MKSWNLAVIVLVGCLAAGCASGGNTELLERELRLQEDRIFELEYELEERDEMLANYQAELESLRKTHAEARRDGKPLRLLPREDEPAPTDPGELHPPKVELPPNLKPGEDMQLPPTSRDAASKASPRPTNSILADVPRPSDPVSDIRVVGGDATPIPPPPRAHAAETPAVEGAMATPPTAQKRRPTWSPNRK